MTASASASVETATTATVEASACDRASAIAACVAAATVEASAVAAAVDEASAADVVGRVEPIAEGAPKEAVTGKPGVAEGAACPVPARIEAGVGCVLLGEAQVGFTEVLGTEAAPFVEGVGLCLIFVEALRLELLAVERYLMAAFDVDGFDVGLGIGARIDGGLAVEDADSAVAGVERVKAILEELSLTVLQIDDNRVLRVDLIDFDVGASLVEPDLGVGEIGGDHLGGAVVAETEKDTGSEQDLGLTVCGGENLTGFDRRVADGLRG